MRLLSLSACVAILSAAAFAQLDSGTVTITASRQATVQSVSVYAAPDASFDDILAGLAGTSITATNFSSASPYDVSFRWQFSLTVPFSKMQPTVAALTAVQQKTGPKAAIQEIGYYVQDGGFSPEAAAAQSCVYTSLLSDTQSQAQKLATAAGQKVGEIRSMADSGAAIGGVRQQAYLFSQAARQPGFSASGGYYAVPCTLTVQFRLLP